MSTYMYLETCACAFREKLSRGKRRGEEGKKARETAHMHYACRYICATNRECMYVGRAGSLLPRILEIVSRRAARLGNALTPPRWNFQYCAGRLP